MNVFEKIKLWFTSISKVVNFLVNTYKDAEVLADKKANFKNMGRLCYRLYKRCPAICAMKLPHWAQSQPVQTKGKVINPLSRTRLFQPFPNRLF